MEKSLFVSYRFSRCYRSLRTFCTGKTLASEDLKEKPKNGKVNAADLLENAAIMEDEVPTNPEDVWTTSPYPKGALPRSQGHLSFRPRIDPKLTSIILFPGQGTQFVGMCKDLVKITKFRDFFSAASEILNYDLLRICVNGPKEKLDRTEYAQPAILVSSLAALERLKEERPSAIEGCVGAAGFSLGEITALTFADVFSFEQAVQLVKIRAEAMQLASDMAAGAMVTVLYSPDSKIGTACVEAKEYANSNGVENAYCAVSNYLFPHCKIIAGSEKAIEFLEKNKDQFKLKKLKRLPVSGAFHTPLMEPAIEPFKAALHKMRINDPILAVHSNVDGKHYRNASHVKRQLPKQILAPVKWEQTLHVLYERPQDMAYPRTFECGPGQSMRTILKMVNLKAWESCQNVPV